MAQEIDFSARVVVGRKIPAIYQQRHNEQPREFYADLMSHLLKYSGKIDPLILDVAERGSSTSNLNLQHAVDIAQQRSRRGTVTHELRNTTKFNVQPYDHEILLALATTVYGRSSECTRRETKSSSGFLNRRLCWSMMFMIPADISNQRTIIGRNTIL